MLPLQCSDGPMSCSLVGLWVARWHSPPLRPEPRRGNFLVPGSSTVQRVCIWAYKHVATALHLKHCLKSKRCIALHVRSVPRTLVFAASSRSGHG